MKIDIDGYGYEFDTIHYGGPLDGLTSSVVSLSSPLPPKVHIAKLTEDQEDKTLAQKVMDLWKLQHTPDNVRMAVYKIEGKPEEYDDSSTVPYHFVEILPFKECKQYV